MAEVIRMPLLSDTMEEGVIATWHKKVGDKVKSDDVIAEVETDKATMDVMPYVEGTLLHIAVEKGEAAPVNGIIAVIGKKGEDYKKLLEKEDKQEPKDKDKKEDKQEDKKEDKEKQASKTDKKKKKAASKNASVVRLPLLSDTMETGRIENWLKEEGDKVSANEAIAEVETDKATMEVMPYVDGTLLHIAVPAGEDAKVNQIIAVVGKKGTDYKPLLEEDTGKDNAPEKQEQQNKDTPTDKNPSSTSNQPDHNSQTETGRIKASPLAKKMAEEKDIPLEQVTGTGDGGRIIKRDIENYEPATQAKSATAVGNQQESYEDIPLTQMRKTVARRLSESKYSAPHFYLTMSIKMDKAMAARKQMNEVSPKKISFNDYTIKACAMALRQHPYVNSSFLGDKIRQNHHISVGTAVAVEEGLIVPVVKFTDTKSLSQIAEETSALIKKAKNKKLSPEEYSGNTFTISNLGMMDIDEFTAIINPSDSCILAVGKINPEPVVEHEDVIVRHIMKVTLSCDHRVVDGAKGAAFLQTLKGYLENPVTMLV